MGVRRILKLYVLYAKMDLAWLLRDKTFAILAILTDAISNLSSVAGIFLIAWRFDGIGQMNRFEVLFMLAYATIVMGILQTFCFGNNVGNISRRIGRGQFEHMFIQPLPLPLQLATEGFLPFTGSSNIISGIILMTISMSNLDITLPLWFIFYFIASTAIILGLSYLVGSIAFYAPVQAEEISSYVIDAVWYIGTFPLSGYIMIPLLTIVPTGLIAWFPTLVLLGREPFYSYYPLLFAVFIWAIAVYFFKKGLNHYVRKGINRYHSMGHRR